MKEIANLHIITFLISWISTCSVVQCFTPSSPFQLHVSTPSYELKKINEKMSLFLSNNTNDEDSKTNSENNPSPPIAKTNSSNSNSNSSGNQTILYDDFSDFSSSTIVGGQPKQSEQQSSSSTMSSSSQNDEVDWDSEWKKVVQNKNQPPTRPGSNYYKNDVQRAIGKGTRQVQESVVKNVLPTIQKSRNQFSFSSLKNDAKFWFAILAAISIGSAVLSAANFSTPPSSYFDSSSSYESSTTTNVPMEYNSDRNSYSI